MFSDGWNAELAINGLSLVARHDADPLWGAVSDIVSWKRKAANYLPH